MTSDPRPALRASAARWPAPLAAGLALALGLAACGDGGGGAPADVDVTEDTAPDDADAAGDSVLEPIPEFTIDALASATTGNAPLPVTFSATVTGDVDPGALEWRWEVGTLAVYTTAEPTHTFQFATTVTVTAKATWRASDGRSRTVSDDVIVRVLGCADLAFGQISLAPPVDVAPGDPIAFKQATLRNDGDAIEVPFTTRVVLSADDLLDAEDRVVFERSFEGLPSGLFSEVAVDLTGDAVTVPADMPDGNYFVFLVADPDEAVNECQETNNRARSTNNLSVEAAIALKADLAVTEVAFPEGLVVNVGQNLNYSFRVSNVGQGEAGQFRLAAWLSDDEVLDEETDTVMFGPEDLGAKVNQMAVNQSQPYFKSFTMPAGLADGPYWILVKADANEQVVEDEEANNVGVSPFPLTLQFQEEKCFDLVLADLVVAPTATYWGGSVQMIATVQNGGTQPTPQGAKIRAFLSQQPSLNPSVAQAAGTWTLPVIAPGETVVVNEVVSIPSGIPVIDHYIGVIADPDDAYTECSESNNAELFPGPISVASTASVDLVVSGAEYHPSTVKAGQDLKVTYSLGNTGSSAATAFKVAFVLSPDPTITVNGVKTGEDLTVGEIVVPTVDAASEVVRVDKVTVPLALEHTIGTYWLGVVADAAKSQGSDKNSINNVSVATTPLTVLEPQGGCFEDELEPNNVQSAAAALGAGLAAGLGSCGNDDWYRVSVPADHSLLVTAFVAPILSLSPVPSDVDLQLYDGAGKLLDTSAQAGDVEAVQAFTVPAAGDYLLRVFPKAAGTRARYDLDVQVKPPVEGIDLLPNDVAALPATLYPGGLMVVAWSDVNVGDTDAGPYAARIWASKDAALDPAVDLPLATVDLDGAPAKEQVPRQVELLLPADLDGGTWRFLVQLDPDGVVGEVETGNNVAASDTVFLDPQLTCADDGFEPNNAPAIATPLALGGGSLSLNNLAVCPKLEDWYAVALETGEAFSVTVTYPHDAAKGLLSVEIWDPAGEAQLLANNAKNTAKVTLPWVWSGGTYLVRVVNSPQGGKTAPYTYSMSALVGPGDPTSACDADVFEDNNAFPQAATIGCGLQAATLCKGDADHYRIELEALQTLTVTLQHPEAQLSMALYDDPAAGALATKAGNGSLTFFAEQDQTLWLRVTAKGDPLALSSLGYTLFMDGVPGVDLVVSDLAVFLSPVYQGEDTLVDMGIENTCVDPSAPFDVTMWLSKDLHLDATDVDVGTFTLAGGVPGKKVVDVSQKVSVPYSTLPGTYYVLAQLDSGLAVEESNEGNNTAGDALVVDELCLPDDLEPNDLLAPTAPYAPLVAPPGASGLALCPSELDWIAVDVPPGSAVTVSVVFDPAEGDLDMRLYDPTQSTTLPVAKSQNVQAGVETATYQPPVGGLVLVRVNGFNGSSAAYDLEVAFE